MTRKDKTEHPQTLLPRDLTPAELAEAAGGIKVVTIHKVSDITLKRGTI